MTVDIEDESPVEAAVRPPPPWWTGWLAGGLGAAVALVIGEIVEAASDDIPGLVLGVGEWFVDVTPGDVVAASIESIGSAQKTVLLVGITIVAILVGGLLGRLSQTVHRAIGPVGFGAFGLFGGYATARNPLSPAAASWIWALVAAAAGAATLLFLLSRLDRPTRVHSGIEDPRDPHATRRAFLGWSAGAGAVALTGAGVGRRVEGRSAAEVARESVQITSSGGVALPPSAETFDGIEGLDPYLTPVEDFYRIDTALSVPQVDPDGWSLKFTGMVDEPYELTYEEIRALDLDDHVVTLSCVSNEVGGSLVGNARWTGIPLATLLDRAGVQDGATQVVGRSVDDWTAGFPTEAVYDGRTAILAIGQNGEPLTTTHGFPARLVVAGLYGYVSAVKWIEEIHLTTWEDFDGYWVPRGWSKEGPMKTASRIDVPRSNDDRPAGPVVVAGVAWAPNRDISSVEISIDEGDWIPCELGASVGPETWRQWRITWEATPGSHMIQVRAIDGDGDLQPIGPARPDPNGSEGWHRRFVEIT